MTFEEQEEVLRHWESLDGKMSDEIREECIEAIASSEWTKAQWMDYLHPVPGNVGTRYCKALKLLLDKKMIDDGVYQASVERSRLMSPVRMAKEGKVLMDWYRDEEKMGFPTLRDFTVCNTN
jgi:hypothetical protein